MIFSLLSIYGSIEIVMFGLFSLLENTSAYYIFSAPEKSNSLIWANSDESSFLYSDFILG